jgi:hypothetical protein
MRLSVMVSRAVELNAIRPSAARFSGPGKPPTALVMGWEFLSTGQSAPPIVAAPRVALDHLGVTQSLQVGQGLLRWQRDYGP